jgi:hypothetical protein
VLVVGMISGISAVQVHGGSVSFPEQQGLATGSLHVRQDEARVSLQHVLFFC